MGVSFMEQESPKETVIQNFCFGHPPKSHSVRIYVAIVSFSEIAMNVTEIQSHDQAIHISLSQQ